MISLVGIALVILSLYSNVIENAHRTSNHLPGRTEYKRIQKRSSHSVKSQVNDDSLVLQRRLPQAIIIGSRKCGTRALLKFLEINPSIKAARKEVHFFDKQQNYNRGLNWYIDQMPESFRHQITIEKSPAYFVTPDVAERVHAMNASIKLILIIRDPVIRLISDYSQLIDNKFKQPDKDDDDAGDYSVVGPQDSSANYKRSSNLTQSTSDGMVNKSLIWNRAEENFEKYVLRSDGGIDDQRHAVRIGMYSIHLEKWRSIFSREQFHFVDGENLIKNPHEELKKLEIFLNLTPTITAKNFVFNKFKGFYCISNNNSVVAEENSIISASCLSRSKGRKHVSVRKELIKKLQDFYAPYNEYLYSLTGIDFNRFMSI